MGIALLWPQSVQEVDGSVILVLGSGIGGRETSWLHDQWKKMSKERTNCFTLEV